MDVQQLEERIEQLEEKNEILKEWTKTVTARLRLLENPASENLRQDAWSKEEVAYAREKLTRVAKPRPVILTMVDEWEEKFDTTRTYDSIRKKRSL